MRNAAMWRRIRRRNGRVQEWLQLEDIVDAVLCLRGGQYRAVLEVESLNFALKSEEEAEAIMASYRAFLNALTYRIQIVVRVVPSELDSYLSGLRERTSKTGNEALRRLALEHESFVRGLTRQRTLLERRFYLVVPADTQEAFDRRSRWPWRKRTSAAADHDAASRHLAQRCQELMQGLAACGIGAWVLGNEDLAELWSSCLGRELVRTAGIRKTVPQFDT
jgi:hypothetical protein